MFKITKLVHLLNAMRLNEGFRLLGLRPVFFLGDSCFATTLLPLRRRLHLVLHLHLQLQLQLVLGSHVA